MPIGVVHFVVTELLRAPRAAVFAIISDPRRRLDWQRSLSRVQVVGAGPARLGMRWREVTRVGVAFDMEISTFDEPSSWAERGRGSFADAWLQVSFADVAQDTQVSVEVEIAFKGPFCALAPLVRRLMPAELAADVRRVEPLARAIAVVA